MTVTRLKAFAAFWYDFVIGDDWQVAAGVIIALTVIYLLAHHGHPGVWWLIPLALVVLLPTSIFKATRRSS